MARSLRIQYPGAWYHIMNRGACRKPIFHSNTERMLFLRVLSEITLSHQIEVHAYCLMSNHYHLLIRTPKGNLADAMHQLGSVYTIRYNKIHDADGPLFRGRYKSILVDSENYLIHLSRYIHLNPIKPGLVVNPEDYAWSSYQAYLGITPIPAWLFTQVIKQYFLKETWPFEYIEFTNEGNSEVIDEFYNKARTPSILGTDDFIEAIKQNNSYSDYSNEVSDKIILRPTIADIVSVTSGVYNVTSSEVYSSLRGIENIPRLMVMLIAKKYFGYKLLEISQAMTMHCQKTVSSNIARLEKRMKTETSLVETKDLILNFLQ
jgi:putative transposase